MILKLRLFILLFVIICTIFGVGFLISGEDSIVNILEVFVNTLGSMRGTKYGHKFIFSLSFSKFMKLHLI